MSFQIMKDDSGLHRLTNSNVVRFFLSAGVAALVDVVIYFITINYIIVADRVQLGNYSASNHNFSLCISYSCGVVVNFLLTKYAVFNESELSSLKQFRRFALIAFLGFFANYGLLRFFVEVCGIYPTVSRIIAALSLGVASYYVHKLFTFKIDTK